MTTADINTWDTDYDAFMQFWLEVGLYADQKFGFDPDFADRAKATFTKKQSDYDKRVTNAQPPLRIVYDSYRQFKNTAAASCGPDASRTMKCEVLGAVPSQLLWYTNVVGDQPKTLSFSTAATGPSKTDYLAKPQNGIAITMLRVIRLAHAYIVDDNADAEAIFTAMQAVNDTVRRTPSGLKFQKLSLTAIAQLLLFVLTGGMEKPGVSTYMKRNYVYRAFVNFADTHTVKVMKLPEGGRDIRFSHTAQGGGWAQTHDGTWMPLNLPA
jgi:hypothetical protein